MPQPATLYRARTGERHANRSQIGARSSIYNSDATEKFRLRGKPRSAPLAHRTSLNSNSGNRTAACADCRTSFGKRQVMSLFALSIVSAGDVKEDNEQCQRSISLFARAASRSSTKRPARLSMNRHKNGASALAFTHKRRRNRTQRFVKSPAFV